MRLPIAVLLVLLSASGCQQYGNGETTVETSSGRLVIIGGGLEADNTPVFEAILRGRAGGGSICVFPTASASPERSMEAVVERIESVGGPGSAEGILLTVDHPTDAGLPDTVERIRGCAGFYFSGGVQTRITQVFRPDGQDSPALLAVRDRFREGAVVSGTSAGAAIMSHPMIGGGGSTGALQSGIRGDESGEGVVLETGLGFLRAGLVDQHFLARGRWGRLLVAILGSEGTDLGLGVDENTALVVEGDSAWVVGESGVVVMNTGSSLIQGNFANATPEEGTLRASNVRMYLLGPGDHLDLATGQVRFSDEKSALSAVGGSPVPDPKDLFERWSLLHFFAESARSSEREFLYQQHGYRFEIRKGRGYRAVSHRGGGKQGEPRGLAVGPLLLDLVQTDEL